MPLAHCGLEGKFDCRSLLLIESHTPVQSGRRPRENADTIVRVDICIEAPSWEALENKAAHPRYNPATGQEAFSSPVDVNSVIVPSWRISSLRVGNTWDLAIRAPEPVAFPTEPV